MSAPRPDLAEARGWLAFADDDLAYGLVGMTDHPRPAAWSFLQASEKALKAVLIAKGLEVPRTHDVGYLLSLLVDTVSDTGQIRQAVLALATVSPASRYPDDGMEFSSSEVADFAAAARSIVAWAHRHCG